MVSDGYADGVNDTVWVVFAGTVTDCETVTGAAPPAGAATVALTVPVCAAEVLLVTLVFTVSAEELRSAVLACTTCESASLRPSETSSCSGNWMPVLLSGGIWLQSTSSRVSMVFGLFG